MTNDSRLFPPLEQWEAKGYKPDVFGRWIGPEGRWRCRYTREDDPQFDLSEGWMSGMGQDAAGELILR